MSSNGTEASDSPPPETGLATAFQPNDDFAMNYMRILTELIKNNQQKIVQPTLPVAPPSIFKNFPNKVMDFLPTFSNQLNMDNVIQQDVSMAVDEIKMQELAEQFMRQSLPKPEPRPIASMFPLLYPGPQMVAQPTLNPFFNVQLAQFIQTMTELQIMNPIAVAESQETEKSFKQKRRGSLKPSLSLSSEGDEPYDNMGDVIVPSNNNEGWCRNKKYIESTEKGFMCIVCNKVYSRYNSVSYHVTIYHRNPPHKCDQPGCNFSTREARYIHFHKFYRHQIPLPSTIDQGSRRCKYCNHIAKSPAMLDKHVRRHQLNGLKEEPISVDGAEDEQIVVDDVPEIETRCRAETMICTQMLIDEEMETKPRALTIS